MEVDNNILLPEVKRLLEQGHQVEMTPKGVSMRPYIEGGRDSVILVNAATCHVDVGDIVLAKIGNRYVLHRVLSRYNDQIILRGDGNLVGVEQCTRTDIIAVVVMIVRPGKREKYPSSAFWWRHAPYFVRKYGLKWYRKVTLPRQTKRYQSSEE